MNLIRLKIAKLWILFLSNVRLETNASLAFYGRYLWLFFFCVIYLFLFRTVLSRSTILLNHYTITYPLFFISGIAFFRLVICCVTSVDQAISNLKQSGIIQWLLITPTQINEIILAQSMWRFSVGMTEFLALILFSNILIGTPIKPYFQGSIFCTYVLTAIAYIGLGMALQSIILLLRKGSFLCTIAYQVSIVFGGIYFPIDLLPKFMFWISQLLPITHALKIIRYAITHTGQAQPWSVFVPLLVTSFIYFGIGLFALQKSLAYTRQNGSLVKDSND